MDNGVILKIDDLTKSFTRNIVNVRGEAENERFNIIDKLDLEIVKGKITALIGGNGAGKTTLFNIISQFVNADSGNIEYYHGDETTSLLKLQPDKIYRKGIGRLFQDNHIFLDMTVTENMLIADDNRFGEKPFLSLFKSKKNNEIEKNRIEKMEGIFIKLFGENNEFWEKRNDLARSLSYGQQRLLGLARIFMSKYKIVLLDEPTAGVNPKIINKICTIIKKMPQKDGLTVFLIEHNMKVVENVADWCCFMSDGKITAVGSSKDVIGNPDVRKTYLGI